MKDRVAAGLLAIFAGGFGIHRFYLGQTGIGLIYLIFCWTGIPAIIGLFEGIYILTLTEDDFRYKYNLNALYDEDVHDSADPKELEKEIKKHKRNAGSNNVDRESLERNNRNLF